VLQAIVGDFHGAAVTLFEPLTVLRVFSSPFCAVFLS